MQEQLTKDQKHYRKKKLEKGFLESRRVWQKEYREKNESYKEKTKAISKKYYNENKELVNSKMKERLKNDSELVTDSYIKRTFRDTPNKEIEIKKAQVLINRINKQIKIKQNEL